ncbi:MAG: PulJ/GspJ family protein [Pyrinomonadaceae bacterium]
MIQLNVENNHIIRDGKTEAGFSLLELLISIVIFLIVTGSIFGLMEISRIDRNRASRRSDTLKNARAAIHLIGRDALNAGLSYNLTGGSVPEGFLATRLGIAPDLNTTRDALTSIISGNDVNTNSLLPSPKKTDLIAFAYRDMDFNKTKKYDKDGNEINTIGDKITVKGAQAASGAPNTTSITIDGSTVTSDSSGNNQPGVNDLYLVETADGIQVAVMATKVDLPNNRIEFAPGDPLGVNQSFSGTGQNGSLLKPCNPPSITDNCANYAQSASLKRFNWVSYKINSQGTLIRTVYGNNRIGTVADQIQEQPLAYGIQNMQVRYVLEDGTVTDDPAAGPDGILGTGDDTPANLNLVRQITVTLNVQSNENDEQTGKPETITVSATFSTRNLEYDAG